MKKYRSLLAVLALIGITACSPEVGSEKWCKQLKEKDKANWTANEAKDFLKHCVMK